MKRIPFQASKHIGIVACSHEGAALCYRTICLEGGEILGPHAHPEVSMHTHPLSEYMKFIERGQWDGVGKLMRSSAEKLVRVGAEVLVCPDNTIHQAIETARSGIPARWLHIADSVIREARDRNLRTLGILGTKYLMEGPVYPERLDAERIDYRIPTEPQRQAVNEIIFEELVRGEIKNDSRDALLKMIEDLKSRGCDAVVLGCTELPLIVLPDESPLPVLDSTRILARAALEYATR